MDTKLLVSIQCQLVALNMKLETIVNGISERTVIRTLPNSEIIVFTDILRFAHRFHFVVCGGPDWGVKRKLLAVFL